MRRTDTLFVMLLLMGNALLFAQVSSDCSTAVPICNNTPVNGGTDGYGSNDFNGSSSSGCLEQTLSGFIESNSAWYRFRTNATGQLGFNIGHDPSEDWDFALYQSYDCNTLGEPVRCNFFDNSDGNSFVGVGEDPMGQSNSVQYEDWLFVEPGQEYYLLINNFSAVNSGFSIQFSGQVFEDFPHSALDCSIVNNLLGSPVAACSNETVTLDATTTGAVNYTWYENTGFGFQEINGATASTFTVMYNATYRVRVSTPDTTILSEVQVAFTPAPSSLPLQDTVFCYSPDMVFDLSQRDSEVLGGQATNDFLVSYHLSQADADAGSNPIPKAYAVSPGNQTLYVRVTAVQNSRCYDATQSFELHAVEIPDLTFETLVTLCEDAQSALIGSTTSHPDYSYSWDTGATTPNITVNQEGSYTLTVTRMFGGESCTVSRTVSVITSVLPQITEIQVDDLRTNNQIAVVTDVVGEFEYSLDNGPFQSNPVFTGVLPGTYMLTMRDRNGCGEIREEIVVVGFLSHFSPNGDGFNENWHIEGLSYLEDPVVTIYDRYGKLLRQLQASSGGWDGTYNGQPVPATDYWFKLSYRNSSGNRVYARYLQNHFSLRR